MLKHISSVLLDAGVRTRVSVILPPLVFLPTGGGSTIMMGIKERHFSLLRDISLEDLVPKDNFYRRLERTLDLSFVREIVQERYAASSSRSSIDPVVFFKLQLSKTYSNHNMLRGFFQNTTCCG
jgi:hypothetical protein